jgi:hypothetical protein
MIAIHGTSKQNAMSIIENGYKATKTNFRVSDINCCYALSAADNKVDTNSIKQCFLQGFTACIINNEPLDSYVLLIDIAECNYEKDYNFHAAFNSIAIKTHIDAKKIKGIAKLNAPLPEFYKYVWYKRMEMSPINFQLNAEEQEIVNSIKSIELVANSIKRDIQVLKNDSNLTIPNCTIAI